MGVDLSAVNESLYCSDCPLKDCPYVVGLGNAEASVLVVGAAPGETEEATGLAFTGEIGQLLRSLLADFGLEDDEVYYTNVLKRRPLRGDQNRKPTPEECWKCGSHLVHEIVRHRPRAVLALGSTPMEFFGGAGLKLPTVHGLPIPIQRFALRFKLISTYDPGHVARKGGMLGKTGNDFLNDLEEFVRVVRVSDREENDV